MKAKSSKLVMAGSALASVRRDVRALAERDPALAGSALAASAFELARQLDKPKNSATSKAMCARALLETLDRLRELAPAAKESDRLDDLTARRSARRVLPDPDPRIAHDRQVRP